MENEEFQQLFGNKGDKIQPTKHNKPKSVKTIIQFPEWKDVEKLFGDVGVQFAQSIEVSLWKQGSMLRGKSFFMGKGQAEVDGLTVEYNKSSRNLKLIFRACQSGAAAMLGSYGFMFC